MSDVQIGSVADKFKLYISDPLEEYRRSSFFDKEPETVAWIETIFSNDDVFFDVGANIGVYSLFAAAHYADLKVFAFEPNWTNYCQLLQNCKLNEHCNVTPIHFAVASECSLETLYVSDLRPGNSGSQLGSPIAETGEKFAPVRTEQVLSCRLDKFCEIFSVASPDHLKIDVDGLEMMVLQGAQGLFGDSLRSVLVECSHKTGSAEEVTSFLSARGYTADNDLNRIERHSSKRRQASNSGLENIIFMRENVDISN